MSIQTNEIVRSASSSVEDISIQLNPNNIQSSLINQCDIQVESKIKSNLFEEEKLPAKSLNTNGIFSFFTLRQRKSPSSHVGVSVKQSRITCLAKIDETIQTVNDLLEFYSLTVKAERKVSGAFWKTLNYSKLKRIDSDRMLSISTSERYDTNRNKMSTAQLNLNSSGESSAVDSGISEPNTSSHNESHFMSQSEKLLQCFANANELRAELAACRAIFHKKTTIAQLVLISDGLQRLRTLYLERDSKLESYSSQLENDVREYWKKYAKYADSILRLNNRLNAQIEKGIACKRKAIENCLNDIQTTTQKLYTTHNAYTLSLAIARQYNKCLITKLRPSLCRNLFRCLSLIDFSIIHLMQLAKVDQLPTSTFDLLSMQQTIDPVGFTDLNDTQLEPVDYNESSFHRAFPFDEELIVRSGDGMLRPNTIVVNDSTFNQVQLMLQTHLQETANQESMTNIFKKEHEQLVIALTSCVDILLSNKGKANDLPSLLKTESTVKEYLQDLEIDQPTSQNCAKWQELLKEDQAYLKTAMKPSNICALTISLGTCEFFHGQYTCYGESHAHIVNILQEAKVTTPITPGRSNSLLFSTGDLQTDGADFLDSRFNRLRIQADGTNSNLFKDCRKNSSQTYSDNEETVKNNSTPSHDKQTGCSVQLIKAQLYRQWLANSSTFPTHNTNAEMQTAGEQSVIQDQVALEHFNNESFENSSICLKKFSSPNQSSRIFNDECYRPPALNGCLDAAKGEADVTKEPWFHGVLPRTEVVRLLQKPGDFLVRETCKATSHRNRGRNCHIDSPSSTTALSQSFENLHGDKRVSVVTKMVLSVYCEGDKHFIIRGCRDASVGQDIFEDQAGGWALEDYVFPTIRDLIEYHLKTGKPVTQNSGACLTNPIARPDWQLENADVHLLEKIGQGNFGDVHRGVYNGRMVAVKTCRANAAETEIRRNFLQGEATALNFCHPNIVQLIGIAARSHPIMIVMEYVAGGSLLSFLRNCGSNAEISQLLRMSVDAANGMAYLESKNCIHRDLAARNCLLTEQKALKIADFGMAREQDVYELSNGPIPIKWTAPEALFHNRYTVKCDVWSFGVLLWEIFTSGDTPYRGLSNTDTRNFVESGNRLAVPQRMPRRLGKYMNSCWHSNPDRRPSFEKLVLLLSKLEQELSIERVDEENREQVVGMNVVPNRGKIVSLNIDSGSTSSSAGLPRTMPTISPKQSLTFD